jgi:hypothetical protein
VRFDTKDDNITAIRLGLFGNAPRQWETTNDVMGDVGPGHLIVVRPRVPGGRCWYDTTLLEWCRSFVIGEEVDPSEYYFNEPIDKSTVTLNAEVTRKYGELYMRYAVVKDHMRPALKNHERHAFGLTALSIMRVLCCEQGYECVCGLLDLYPDHVVEFTCMDRAYGTLGWNTVVWECRSY